MAENYHLIIPMTEFVVYILNETIMKYYCMKYNAILDLYLVLKNHCHLMLIQILSALECDSTDTNKNVRFSKMEREHGKRETRKAIPGKNITVFT